MKMYINPLIKFTITILCILLFAIGCQKTPTNTIVINKDENKIEEIISSTNEPQETLLATQNTESQPQDKNDTIQDDTRNVYENWMDQIQWKNEKKNIEVIIDIDAKIIYPKYITYLL